jgi:hypothetical protein
VRSALALQQLQGHSEDRPETGTKHSLQMIYQEIQSFRQSPAESRTEKNIPSGPQESRTRPSPEENGKKDAWPGSGISSID